MAYFSKHDDESIESNITVLKMHHARVKFSHFLASSPDKAQSKCHQFNNHHHPDKLHIFFTFKQFSEEQLEMTKSHGAISWKIKSTNGLSAPPKSAQKKCMCTLHIKERHDKKKLEAKFSCLYGEPSFTFQSQSRVISKSYGLLLQKAKASSYRQKWQKKFHPACRVFIGAAEGQSATKRFFSSNSTKCVCVCANKECTLLECIRFPNGHFGCH